jgi:hypothetical protein
MHYLNLARPGQVNSIERDMSSLCLFLFFSWLRSYRKIAGAGSTLHSQITIYENVSSLGDMSGFEISRVLQRLFEHA